MTVTLTCHCGSKVEAKEDAPERRVNCPNCGSVIFLGGLGGAGADDTYGISGDFALASSDDDAAAAGTDSAEAEIPVGWLDRYLRAAKSKKGDQGKSLDMIRKMGETNAANDPLAAPLYLAATQPQGEATVAGLAKVAVSGHPVYAPIATGFLEHIGSTEGRCAREALKLLQETQDAKIQAILLKALLAIGPSASLHVRDLIQLLGSKQAALHLWAVRSLGLLGPAAKGGIEALYKALKTSDNELRLAVIDSLGEIQRDAERAVPLFLQALKHKDPDYRRRGAQALGRFGAQAAQALGALDAATQDESPVVKEAATEALKALNAAIKAVSGGAIPVAGEEQVPETMLVPCQCGKNLRIKTRLAGKRVKCPACGGPVDVPAAPTGHVPTVKLPEEKECPACLANVPAVAILCVHCGLDFRTGRQFGADKPAAVEA